MTLSGDTTVQDAVTGFDTTTNLNNNNSGFPDTVPPDSPELVPPESLDPVDEEGVNPLEEIASAVGGGAIDAVESLGGFAELSGDTIKTGINALIGKELDPSQNPFDENYLHGDANWLNVPEEITDWNGNVLWEDTQPKTAIGRFRR